MHLVVLLSSRALSRVRAAIAREHQVTTAADWSELDRIVRRLPIAAAMVDPRPGGRVALDELRGLRREFPSLPVLLHVTPSAAAMHDVVELARDGFHHIVIEGYEDDAGHIREQLMTLVSLELEGRVLAMLAPALRQAPASLTGTLSRLFLAPHEFGSVEDLARAAGTPRRTFDRWLRTLGLAPAHTLLVGARFLRAYQYARDPGYDLTDIAAKVGYPAPVVLTRQIRRVTGELPSEWRRHATADATLGRLGTLLFADENTQNTAHAGAGHGSDVEGGVAQDGSVMERSAAEVRTADRRHPRRRHRRGDGPPPGAAER